jgi:DNA polymerase-3 subunit gamma/tau
VLELLGAVDAELLFDAVDAVAAQDPKGVLLEVEKMARSGRDPAQFARDLLAHLRHLLVTQTVGEAPNTFVVTATDAGRLAAQANTVGAATLVRTIEELAAALTAVREGDEARMAVEIALLKAARPDLDPSAEGLLRRVERLEKSLGAEPSRAAGPVAAGDPPHPAVAEASSGAVPPATPPAAETEAQDSAQAPTDAENPSTEAPAGGPGGPSGRELRLDEVQRVWPAVLDQLLQAAPALAASFEGARPVAADGDERTVTIGFPPNHTFNKRKAEAPDKREQVAEALQTITGERLRPVYALLDGDPETAEPAEGVDQDALVEKLKSEFDAEEVG